MTVIRQHGLKNRMNDPIEFIRAMNRHCIEKTHSRRRPDSRKGRKKILRLLLEDGQHHRGRISVTGRRVGWLVVW